MTDQAEKPGAGRPGTDSELTAEEAAGLLAISGQAVRAACAESSYPGATKDASGAWRIPLSSLPTLAQALYWAQHAEIAPDGWTAEERRELPDDEAEILWRRFEDASVKLKEKSKRAAEACHLWRQLKAEGAPVAQALAEIKEHCGLSKSALYEKLSIIKGHAPMHWPALLLGQWTGGNARRSEWPAGAWDFFLRHALTPGRKIRTAWRSTQREARAQGWGEIPSYDAAKADFRRLPNDVVTLAKEGETALKAMSPKLMREYDLLLHDTWSLDGRRIDLMVRDTKGKYGPKGRVFRLWISAFMEVRSRMLLGYAFGASLNADLTRAAFIEAIKFTGRLVPRGIVPDNGMEIAAKEITGGTPWRRRGKVMEDEIVGLFPMLEIAVAWATVAHGQAKPVERLFGTLAQAVETRPEFRGAYCGNTPAARPEEWEPAKAAPIELVEKLYAEEIAAYHRAPHRGEGMGGKSPLQVYTEQINAPGLAVRRITEAQARLCTYSAAPVTIRKDGSFTILGAAYRSHATAALARGRGYYARYSPHNLSDTVFVYRREKLLCEAERIELTSFNDKAAGKRIMKDRATYTRAVKQHAAALQALSDNENREYIARLAARTLPETIAPETGEVLPAAKVLEMVKGKAATLPAARSAADEAARQKAKQQREAEGRAAADRMRQRAASRA